MDCNTDVGFPFKVLCDLQMEEHLHFCTFFLFWFIYLQEGYKHEVIEFKLASG